MGYDFDDWKLSYLEVIMNEILTDDTIQDSVNYLVTYF